MTLGFQHFGRFLFHKVKIIQISLLLKACWHVVHSWKYKRIICGLVTEYGRKLRLSRHKLFISLPCWGKAVCMFFLDMTDLANWTCSIVEGQVHRKEGISHSTYNSEVFCPWDFWRGPWQCAWFADMPTLFCKWRSSRLESERFCNVVRCQATFLQRLRLVQISQEQLTFA